MRDTEKGKWKKETEELFDINIILISPYIPITQSFELLFPLILAHKKFDSVHRSSLGFFVDFFTTVYDDMIKLVLLSSKAIPNNIMSLPHC